MTNPTKLQCALPVAGQCIDQCLIDAPTLELVGGIDSYVGIEKDDDDIKGATMLGAGLGVWGWIASGIARRKMENGDREIERGNYREAEIAFAEAADFYLNANNESAARKASAMATCSKALDDLRNDRPAEAIESLEELRGKGMTHAANLLLDRLAIYFRTSTSVSIMIEGGVDLARLAEIYLGANKNADANLIYAIMLNMAGESADGASSYPAIISGFERTGDSARLAEARRQFSELLIERSETLLESERQEGLRQILKRWSGREISSGELVRLAGRLFGGEAKVFEALESRSGPIFEAFNRAFGFNADAFLWELRPRRGGGKRGGPTEGVK